MARDLLRIAIQAEDRVGMTLDVLQVICRFQLTYCCFEKNAQARALS
ncbi:MAG: hypothetical protein ACOY9Y_11385 [Bacillota bacterium]